ncbi:substrate-binding domain-containing protein [Streptomyces sp. SID8361]|uniref:sugar ABC transporter substrate-binding protein n=1 Tax=Streptomyces sp. MnatMP-M27 TaxID=1839768 RepID=UPI00081E827D|nr:sugar ABC transporter substrate-binding protein [Streptomyces sp. MnatMP-M27]MYU11637.1 substrate-binding domain-containing protein [Streptomyces sp. SID8361]SCF83474.1 ABC-type sugar transport system, substrate-binding protein, contains N-terminal xre family HTH domain [Streptomyces sp. MnatMP-M27]
MTIQFVNPLPSYPTWRQIGDCMKDEAKKLDVDLTESGPTGQALDATAMIKQVNQAVANKKDAIITFPSSVGFTQILKQAQDAGIVTGTLYGPGGKEFGADYNIAPDFSVIGESLVNAVSTLPGKHVLGLVAAANTGLGKSWMAGVKAAAAKADNVSIAGEVYTGDDAAKALPQVSALLTAHPDVTEIVTHMGTTTPGAVSAIKSHGLKGKTFLLAGGHDNGGSKAVDDGTANLILLQDVCTLGKQLVDGVVNIKRGKPVPEVPVKIKVVGKDQLQALLGQGWV